ncbi:MAG TPA: BACON domain-containing protein [Anaerolineales bacterium]|nr:BACON domain-containing protein [Anaerolineales bacterium]
MYRKILKLSVLLALFLTLTASITLAETVPRVTAQEIPLDIPTVIVTDGVMTYDIASPKIFWYGRDDPACSPTEDPSGLSEEWIYRIPTYGGVTRQLWLDTYNPYCNQFDVDLNSNLIADASYTYWMSDSANALVRLSEDANVGDPYEVLSASVTGGGELAQDEDYIYLLQTSGLRRIAKVGGASTLLTSNVGTNPGVLQVEGNFAYWLTSGVLKRFNLTTNEIVNLQTGVSNYYPEGRLLTFCTIDPFICYYTDNVFIGRGRNVDVYNNETGNLTTIYTSSDTTAVVHTLVTSSFGFGTGHLFFVESRNVSCNPFCSVQDYLMRRSRGSGGTNDVLYASPVDISYSLINLKYDDDFIYWQEGGGISRLPADAEALPLTNMKITGIEVNQALQDPSNSVRLILGKRTFVRVYVSSDGDPVSGVGAYLYRTDSGGNTIGAPLTPVNPVGQQITVKSWANRMDINQSFLFELPMSWVTSSPLRLRASLNPWRVPPESSYADNAYNYGPFTLSESPRLGVYFVSFGYSIGNNTYYPHLINDVFQTYSWIRRAYPLDSSYGNFSDPGVGFRPNLWIMYDEGLGSRVERTANECTQKPFYYYDDEGELVDNRSLCASAYTNNLMNAMRVENGVPSNIFMYGMISDAAGIFPRGQAFDSNVSSGPAGTGTWGWDFDGSYADWYAGHEIGHTLGRAHPDPNSDDPNTDPVEGCGHSRSDPSYPYNDARISDGSIEGFDVGDPGLNPLLVPSVYPALFWYDMMSYCDNQWLSDYTYEGMYQYMLAHPTEPDAVVSWYGGDFLSLFGVIAGDGSSATIQHIKRLGTVSDIPPLVAGDFTIRLRNAGSVLADYSFTPEWIDDGQAPYFSFGQVVNFVTGTTQVQILDDAQNVLTTLAVTSNAPVVTYVNTPNLETLSGGAATFSWGATDADGDALTFDLQYSTDGGVTFQPVAQDVVGTSIDLDPNQLAGSYDAVMRVVASDGVNTGYLDSDVFTMAAKPPLALILSPGDGTTFLYEQTLSLSGMSYDVQNGSVAEFNHEWSDQNGILGYGTTLSLSQLPIGEHQITLKATNSWGLIGTDTITIYISDNLDLPGPTLAASPNPVNWHVGAGETTLQTADVLIDNNGGGTLPDWTATETADWLTLSVTTGSDPSTLTLTADPTGIEPGTVVSTIITITTPESGSTPAQTREIVVTLAVGDVWHTFGEGDNKVYLPIVTR